ncbi:polysaccharide deacetylase family protein [Polyangium aurulentum]|uniref:polysaccharide deacetylase family protein n=1 Tax=Polyangium aurulentum TaxID=2567896 RepID=UPI0010AE36F5|nr:polysaccharide deacetylase family protein [Polyangium aurulentum]UQA55682.1 polysaccharide deacetylase family protein [Polyangium aurulentum]
MSPRLAALSVDLDGIPHYHAIHGLAPLPAEATATHAVYDLALARMDAFARAHDLPLTLFAIGADLERPQSASALRSLVERGHAAGNHSLSHRYDLVRAPADAIAREVEEGERAIAKATGERPAGFRAPGYTVSDALFDALEALGVRYDSSVFPCPGYYGAKALVMGALRLVGRTSASVLDTPRVLTAPARPYRPGRPWYRRGRRAFVELPIGVTRWLRLPFIGTSVALAGERGARWLAEGCAEEPLVNLELHAIDFLGVDDGLEHLAPHQPELRVPLARRMDALSAAVETITRRGARFVRLDEAAERFASRAD